MPKIIDADDRRELVADALYRVAQERGLAQASLRNVAAEADLALGSVRHYFDNQAELMEFAFRVNSERMHGRVLDRLEPLEEQDEDGLVWAGPELIEACAMVLEELLPLDAVRISEAAVHMEFMLAARTDNQLAEVARDDYRATGAVVGRIILALLGSGLVAESRTPVEEAERLMAVLDGLSVRMVLQPSWATAEQGRDTLRRHLASLLEP